MIELAPWVVMGAGVFSLFIYGIFSAGRYRLYAPRDFRPEGSFRRYYKNRARDISRTKAPMEAEATTVEVSIGALSREWMPVILSVLVVVTALYVILSRETYPDAQQKWAFGAVGTVLGYWFKR